jgi:hypothetical protein
MYQDVLTGLSTYIPRGRKGIVAITTRDLEVANKLAGLNVIPKTSMDAAEAEVLFRKNYPRGEKSIEQGNPNLLELLNELQYLPLGIKQAAFYLQTTHLKSLSQYLDDFKTHEKAIV